jgi:predicted transcriptional regulator of viral defense system/very-short-patch-repair endonuclease
VARERKKTRLRAERSCILRADWDRAIVEVASRRAGRISREQLNALGISDDAIAVRVRAGRLIRLYPGVYALDRRDDARARHWAAWLAIGPDSAISDHSAAGEHRMLRRSPLVVDVTTPRRLPRRDGIRVHSRALGPASLTVIDGLPVTTPAQTLFDLATSLGADALAKAANEAFVLGIVTDDDLVATLARNGRRKGAAAFRRLLGRLGIAGRVRSPLEIRLHAFLRARGFPPFESNVRLRIGDEWIEPDVLWRDERVIVEADGRGPHLSPLTFASDRRRDRRARVEGWEAVRVTEEDLDGRPGELEADLRALLARAARPLSGGGASSSSGS